MDYGQSLLNECGGNFLRVFANLSQEADPEHLHLLFTDGVRLEFWQLYEHEVQSVENLLRVFLVNETIVVVEVIDVRLKHIVDQAQRIDRLEQMVFLALLQLAHVGF